jgi:hypothetical protein
MPQPEQVQIVLSERVPQQASLELTARGIDCQTRLDEAQKATLLSVNREVAEQASDLLKGLGFKVRGILSFEPKTEWDEGECINQSSGAGCSSPATLKAMFNGQLLRCCEEEPCKKEAAKRALEQGLQSDF